MHGMSNSFTESEQKEITKQALRLVKCGYLTGVNFIHSEQPLPDTAVIVHYLQDSKSQIDFVAEELKKFGKLEPLILPRKTHYVLDPQYAAKGNFRKEYARATFLDEELSPKPIGEVVKNPQGTIVLSEEIDMLIPLPSGDISALVAHIQKSDKAGPERWLHPALIVKGSAPVPVVPGFVAKDYASLSRPNGEFYSIVADEQRKQRLRKRLEKICQELRGTTAVSQGSVLWFPSQINPELETYINENLRELGPE